MPRPMGRISARNLRESEPLFLSGSARSSSSLCLLSPTRVTAQDQVSSVMTAAMESSATVRKDRLELAASTNPPASRAPSR